MRPRTVPALAIFAASLLVGSGARAEGPATTSSATVAAADLKPLWEAGIFGGAARMPHYRGSDEYSWYFLPLPFLVYRGKVVQTDRDGMRGIFLKSERMQTEISFSGSPPVDRNDQARQGMPQLDAIGEAGPAMKLFLHHGRTAPSLYLEPAVRGAVAADVDKWSTHYVGLRGGLNMVLADYKPARSERWTCGLNVGVDFTDANYNRYFYDVTPAQVIPGREEFQSRGGYAGFALSGYSLVELIPRLSWGLYSRWDNIDGAAYRASPLVRARNDVVLATALIWTIQTSHRLVRSNR
jgi:outer membrane scaffolding protein for murein synthesis (MipA/OmpV family)